MENSQEIYEIFYLLESGEEFLFKNCCKILGIKRKRFIKNFKGTEIFDVDEDVGLTAIAAAERFGTIKYENPNEPSYGTIEDMIFYTDNSKDEYIVFQQKLYYSTVNYIMKNYNEDDYTHTHILSIVEKIGVFNEKMQQQHKVDLK